MFDVLAAISEFERDLIRDRVLAGLRRAKAQGRRLDRPREQHVSIERAWGLLAVGRSLRAVARELGVHPTAVTRALGGGIANPARKPLAKRASRRAGRRQNPGVAI